MRVYVAGPMQGIKDFNYPAFDAASARLRAEGHEVISPADIDRKEGFDNTSADGKIDPVLRRKFLGRDMAILAECDAIYMLKGWENSGGAKLERAFAENTGLQILYEDGAVLCPQTQDNEVRVVDPKTGGMKGSKLARFDLIPPIPLTEVAKVFGMGAEKYAPRNWEKGFKWGLAFAAMQRHVQAFWSGEETDPESGLPHLAHACWHLMVLMEFSRTYREGDDRK